MELDRLHAKSNHAHKDSIRTTTSEIVSHKGNSLHDGGSEQFVLTDESKFDGPPQYNPRSPSFVITVLGCAFAFAGAQVTPLLFLTASATILNSFHTPSLNLWMFTASGVAMGACSPFIGPVSDILGRKVILLVGIFLSMVGMIVCAATPSAAGFVAGQILSGVGAVTAELLAIAVVAEIVPTSKRPMYAALVLCAILPWSPGSLYGTLMSEKNWRYIPTTIALWNALTFVLIAIFYRPPQVNKFSDITVMEKLRRVDFVGAFLIVTGALFFLIGLNWGGQVYPWKSAHVLSFIIVGGLLVTASFVWQAFGTRHPLYPRRLIQAPRVFWCLLVVIFTTSVIYVPLVIFWPIQSTSVYGAGGLQKGINALPIGICILTGAIISAGLCGIIQKQVSYLMTFFCVMQTIALGCLTIADPHNIGTAWPSIVLGLFGVGGVVIPSQILITVITPPDLLATITSLTVCLRSQAQVIGISIFYNRFVDHMIKNAFKFIVPACLTVGGFDVPGIENLVYNLTSVPFSEYARTALPLVVDTQEKYDLLKEATVQGFSHSFPIIYYTCIAFGAVACVAAACMGDVSSYMDDHVAVVL